MVTEKSQMAHRGKLNPLLAVLLGVLSAALGLAPWIIMRAELPVQNLSLSGGIPEPAPWALLPFGQYEVLRLLALLYFGGLIAGMTTRYLVARGWMVSSLGVTAGLLAVQLLAFFQSLTQVVYSIGLDRGLAQFYVVGMSLLILLSILLAFTGFRLLTRASRAAAAPALVFGAMLFVPWAGLLLRFGKIPPLIVGWVSFDTLITILLLSAALIFAASQPGRWQLSWAISLVGIWLFVIVVGSLQHVIGSRAILSQGPEQMFSAFVWAANLNGYYSRSGLLLVVATVVVASLGLLAVRSLSSRNEKIPDKEPQSETPDSEPYSY